MDRKILWPVSDFEIEIGRATVGNRRRRGPKVWLDVIPISIVTFSLLVCPMQTVLLTNLMAYCSCTVRANRKKPACAMDTSLLRSETIQSSRRAMAEAGKESPPPPTLRSFLEETSAHGLRYLVRSCERSCMLERSLFSPPGRRSPARAWTPPLILCHRRGLRLL